MKRNKKLTFYVLLIIIILNIEMSKNNRMLGDYIRRGGRENWTKSSMNNKHHDVCNCKLKKQRRSFKFINFQKDKKRNYRNNERLHSQTQFCDGLFSRGAEKEDDNDDDSKYFFTPSNNTSGISTNYTKQKNCRYTFLFSAHRGLYINSAQRMNSAHKFYTSKFVNFVTVEKKGSILDHLKRYKCVIYLGKKNCVQGNVRRSSFSLLALSNGRNAIITPVTHMDSTADRNSAPGVFLNDQGISYTHCGLKKRRKEEKIGHSPVSIYRHCNSTTECRRKVIGGDSSDNAVGSSVEIAIKRGKGVREKKRFFSEESKRSMKLKLRNLMRKKWKDPEFRKKMLKSFKKRGIEHNQKISEAVKNKWKNDLNYKQKTLEGQRKYFMRRYKNKKLSAISEKTREKISKAMKQYWANKNKFKKAQVNNLQHLQKKKKKHKKVWEDIYSLILNQKVGDLGSYQSSLHHNLSINLQAALS
ncbi:hypothetical protein, conserved [Plasmodium gonderi]|uniref:Uncharacterized protein n=1 Tax=Plasmodium gonderi TaxID=77519 RepID=A0A1Y1JCC9_PLAGO|nr:hypothetical protein, conserved [Plasmodium gonderi]GAW80181.1 hypothetical protein, conserved [Plasmodium gonderi]